MAPDYTTFQTEDFVLDESFQAFVAGSDAAAVQFWQRWLAEHPAQQPAAEQAQQLVLMLGQARQPVTSAQRKAQDLQRLRRAIRQPQPAPMLRTQGLRRKRLVAGALLFLLVLGAGFWLWPAAGLQRVQYATLGGEQRAVQLPDGSVVVLNGNSRLTTAANWDAQSPREVWLEGEAFFRVSHLTRVPNLPVAQATGNAKFVVHAGELNVSVLGTTFNVINRPDGFNKVTLNSGKVLVEHTSLLSHDALLMAPGELVEFTPVRHTLAKHAVAPEAFSAWASGTLVFDHTPMPEIIRLFRDTYGLEVVVADPALLRQTVTGTLPNKSADVLLKALSKSMGIRTERHGNQVHLLPLN
ncbi:FecR domain-containing protein [Hymenobacter sp. M29]|uniref:FecR domain-containing protein n=1 Tax=Hymenobacter mellowenesis TaxID=3063995 RepID=A0ABT9AGP8_9BACT|nr:FecR domain-containing protein [Hymenobacter sp. M29]MDO7848537.1 FecR domain-containing protein [Hymenobacter sp. M29]